MNSYPKGKRIKFYTDNGYIVGIIESIFDDEDDDFRYKVKLLDDSAMIIKHEDICN